MDKTSTGELLDFILFSIDLIQKRFANIENIDDFLANEEGLEILDSILMRLQTIGEALKNIHKREPGFLENVSEDEYWSEIIKLREIISHHYVDINAEIVYEICSDELLPLREKVETLKQLLK